MMDKQEYLQLLWRPQSPAPLIESEDTSPLLLTPINVQRLVDILTYHPNQEYVSWSCNNVRYGADMGFTRSCVAGFSLNLPIAVSQPSIVTENLSREVALGWVTGPFPSPPLPNFQVSPIGLVPKKHTAKFRTVFHLSCTLEELQSLIESLNFACKVIPLPPRNAFFLQCMIKLTCKVSKPHHIKLGRVFFKDLTMWQQFIHTCNGASFSWPLNGWTLTP